MHDEDALRGVPDIILLGMNILHVHSSIDEIHCYTQHWHKLPCLCSLPQAKPLSAMCPWEKSCWDIDLYSFNSVVKARLFS